MRDEEAPRTSRRRSSEDEAFNLEHAGDTQITQQEIEAIDEGRDDPDAPVPDDGHPSPCRA
jgi:hypothetical protein